MLASLLVRIRILWSRQGKWLKSILSDFRPINASETIPFGAAHTAHNSIDSLYRGEPPPTPSLLGLYDIQKKNMHFLMIPQHPSVIR